MGKGKEIATQSYIIKADQSTGPQYRLELFADKHPRNKVFDIVNSRTLI